MAKKGGKRSGGGGGGKQRKYTRDNNGRFASTGTGATARGGRLKTASGNKRKTQAAKMTGSKTASTIKGKLKRDPGAAGKIGQAKAAAPSTKAKSPKFVTEQSGRVRRAALGGGRTAIVRANSATIINAKGEPIMTRKGLPNITAGKKWAANPNARGPRLMRNKFASEAAPSRDIARTSRPAGTIRKPRGTARDGRKRTTGTVSKPKGLKLQAKPSEAKPAKAKAADLSQSFFERKARTTAARAVSAERATQGLDRFNPSNKKAFNRSDALRSAADSYSSLARRGKSGDLSAAQLFKGRSRSTTAPKLSRSQKASRTKASNKLKVIEQNIKAQERARRMR